jgi:hypothetical protein
LEFRAKSDAEVATALEEVTARGEEVPSDSGYDASRPAVSVERDRFAWLERQGLLMQEALGRQGEVLQQLLAAPREKVSSRARTPSGHGSSSALPSSSVSALFGGAGPFSSASASDATERVRQRMSSAGVEGKPPRKTTFSFDGGDDDSESSNSSASEEEPDPLLSSKAGPENMVMLALRRHRRVLCFLLKEFQHMNRRHRRDASDSSGSSDGKGRAGVHALRRRIKKKPKKIFRHYVCRTKELLGVASSRQVWRFSDASRKVLGTFGKMRGLWKVHYHLSETLQAQAEGNSALTGAMIVQLLKCLHQVAIDNGSWTTGQLMLLLPDPTSVSDFGGDPSELRVIHSYTKARAELKLAHRKAQTLPRDPKEDSAEEAGEAVPVRRPRTARNRDKNKDKENENEK